MEKKDTLGTLSSVPLAIPNACEESQPISSPIPHVIPGEA